MQAQESEVDQHHEAQGEGTRGEKAGADSCDGNSHQDDERQDCECNGGGAAGRRARPVDGPRAQGIRGGQRITHRRSAKVVVSGSLGRIDEPFPRDVQARGTSGRISHFVTAWEVRVALPNSVAPV